MLVQAQVVPWWGTGRPAEFSPSGFHPVTGITRRCVGAKKIVRFHRFFLHQISLESKLNGRQKVKGGNGSISASISTSLIASLDSKLISLLPLDEVPVHVHRFAARAPCDSKGSECQCGIHRAETASALRSRKTEKGGEGKTDANLTNFF